MNIIIYIIDLYFWKYQLPLSHLVISWTKQTGMFWGDYYCCYCQPMIDVITFALMTWALAEHNMKNALTPISAQISIIISAFRRRPSSGTMLKRVSVLSKRQIISSWDSISHDAPTATLIALHSCHAFSPNDSTLTEYWDSFVTHSRWRTPTESLDNWWLHLCQLTDVAPLPPCAPPVTHSACPEPGNLMKTSLPTGMTGEKATQDPSQVSSTRSLPCHARLPGCRHASLCPEAIEPPLEQHPPRAASQ